MIDNELKREMIYNNKSSALVILNTLPIKEGELLKIRYKKDTGVIDSLVAIGIKDGVGPDCYTLISDQSIPLVTSILNYRPDVSDLVSGSVYIYNNPDSNEYSRFFCYQGELIEEELSENFYFINLEDGIYYYFESTPGSQRIINVSSNLSEKSSFQGVINVTEDGYKDLLDKGEIKDDYIYLVNDGVSVTNLYYNFMSFKFDLDPVRELKDRISRLEESLSGYEWID